MSAHDAFGLCAIRKPKACADSVSKMLPVAVPSAQRARRVKVEAICGANLARLRAMRCGLANESLRE